MSRVLRNKHFLYSTLERILRHDLFLKKNKYNLLQKQQMVQSRALACTSAYAKLIKKRATERFFILQFGKLTQYFCIKSNFWTIKTVFILVKVCIYMLYTRQCQGYCQMGASLPEAPTIYHGRPKFETRSPNGCIKIMILRLTSINWTPKFPAHSALLKQTQKTFGHQP